MVRQYEVKRFRWVLIMFVVMFIAVSVLGVYYTRHVQQQADQRWCELFQTLDAPTPVPSAPRAIQTQRQIHKLRIDLGCNLK